MNKSILTFGLAVALCGVAGTEAFAAESVTTFFQQLFNRTSKEQAQENLDERCNNFAVLLRNCRKNITGGEYGAQQECHKRFHSMRDKDIEDCADLWMDTAIKFSEIQKIASDTESRV